jgi:acetate kinase
MNILVINAGSSSLKYQLINMDDESVIAKGIAERIGTESSVLKHKRPDEDDVTIESVMKDHKDAIKMVIDALISKEYGVLENMDEIGAVGHRVVHGGESFSTSAVINGDVMKAIAVNVPLAPLHNPANIMGIEACQHVMPNTPMVAVFDTAFHQTMPKKAYMYALPYEAYKKYGVRRYGFHGTSHKFVAEKAAEMLGRNIEDMKIITCHLGNGSSIAAVKNGKCIDTSMGLTPLEGLPMGTRCGSVDPAIIAFLMEKEGMDIQGVTDYMNKESGMLGLSELSSDFRDLTEARDKGNEKAALALEVFAYKVKSYIGTYAAAMNGVDCIVFTAGVGENTPSCRQIVCENMEYLGLKFDEEKNKPMHGKFGHAGELNASDSKVKVLLIPTDEELAIARETIALI